MQLDQAHKGFSFSKKGPLDMRMNPKNPLTAREIVNTWPEQELGTIFREFGEDRRWRRAAEVICAARKERPIETTTQLAELLASSLGGFGKKRLHPATLIFQALRICVNDELGAVQRGLEKAIAALAPHGRIGVLSFHSLEDRIVKNIFKPLAMKRKAKRGQEAVVPTLHLLTKKPAVPTQAEAKRNPRARSAKLRFAEMVEES